MPRRTLHKGTQVALNTWIYLHQDELLERIMGITGKSKADIVREALSIYLHTMEQEGVIKGDGKE